MIIDLRSDTVTRPTLGMLEAMMAAKVGDDVFGEDESVNELEEYAAKMFGMEAGVFCASGTMTNQIAIKCHTRPADEVVCEGQSHIYQYEGGGIAFNSGCQVKLIDGKRGRITADEILEVINPIDIHKPVSRVVSLENTSNRGGGSCYSMEEIVKIRDVCTRKNLQLHLDGARLFNALVATRESPLTYGRLFDSISICLSKGLGAPVGSVLLGKKEFIQQGRRIRKIMGGGMRQAGYLAAAGLYALQHNIDRLNNDHLHAKQIAAVLQEQEWVKSILPVETNIIIFEVNTPFTAAGIVQELKSQGVLVQVISGSRIRMVLHLDITPEMVSATCTVISRIVF